MANASDTEVKPSDRWGWADTITAGSMFLYAASVVAIPVALIALVEEFGMSLSQGGAAEGVRAALLVATLLVSGLVAARVGLEWALAIGAAVLAIGVAVYAGAPTWPAVVAAMVLFGAGGGLIEALVNPYIQIAHPANPGRFLNALNAFFSLGVVVTVLASGELLTRGGSWRTVAWTLGGALGLISIAYLGLARRRAVRGRTSLSGTVRHAIAILRRRRFWVFGAMIALGGAAEGGLTFWSASYVQLHYEALPRIGGIATAAFAAGMFTGRLLAGAFVPQHRLWSLILASALAGACATGAAAFADTLPLFLVMLFASGLSVASFWPSIQAYSVDRLGLDPLTTFVLLSCLGIPGFGGAAWLMGLIGDGAGLERSLWVIPASLSLLAALAVLERTHGRALSRKPPRGSAP